MIGELSIIQYRPQLKVLLIIKLEGDYYRRASWNVCSVKDLTN